MTYILGINSAYHESSACLIKDGKIVAVAEEERFNRKKHAKPARIDNPDELPINAINFCLEKAGITLKDVAYIANSFSPAKRLRNIDFNEPVVEGSWGSISGEGLFYQRLRQIPSRLSRFYGVDVSRKFHWVDHHTSHAGSAYFVSPFNEAAVLVVDGIGEIESTTLYSGKRNKLTRIKSINYPHSLGFLWEKLSKFLGFTEYDGCKVMGLASYGNPRRYYKQLRGFVKINEKDFNIDHSVVRFRVNDYSRLEKFLGKKREPNEEIEERHADIAAALQKITEEILLNLINYLHKLTGLKNLCLAGGVALNCVANSVLKEKSYFENIYIQPVAHDAGTAIGAAYFIWNQQLGNPPSFVMNHVYFGPEYSNKEIKKILEQNNLKFKKQEEIEKSAAKLLSEGNIIGWFQGRMEVGPRALGNRTLLADPRNPKMRDILNMKVKHREYFRPFAPSVLIEKTEDWFRIPKKSLSSDFMLFAYDVYEDKRKVIPAVTHVDGTSRIQTVRKETNPRYYKLIKEFEKLTGVPIVLNTSFNDREPIVCSPQDAVNTFLKTRIDYLAIGNFLVSRGENNGK
jgi:carbamoyltransferase